MSNKFIKLEQAQQQLSQLGQNFVIIKNPAYLFPEYEIALLSTPSALPLERLLAVVMDMDGTTTTTELLCIHSQEYMIRQISGCLTSDEWAGLNRKQDYPYIIGNSTTRHIEYLIQTYQGMINPENLKRAFFGAVLWTACTTMDTNRRKEMTGNVINLVDKAMIQDDHWPKTILTTPDNDFQIRLNYFLHHYGSAFHTDKLTDWVRAGMEVYYQRYHSILEEFLAGRGDCVARDLLGNSEARLIAPMPGIGVFLALTRGLLGEESVHTAALLLEFLNYSQPQTARSISIDQAKSILACLAHRFTLHPLKCAVVTSSIYHEAHIVLSEVFRIINHEIETWPVSQACKARLNQSFSDYTRFYDTVITASDSSEIRLKPHHDLYSLALHQLGIAPTDFNHVIGFEDSESGTIAIRTAGIGVCVAVPLSETTHHDFQAATHILLGGIPETLLVHHLFCKL